MNGSPRNALYLQRPRIDGIFNQATRRRLVYVIAGAGYGKTLAVRDYVERHPDAVVRWVQLTENDNVGSYYWENVTRSISQDNPELAAKLRELGFPETLFRFKQFADILRETERRSNRTLLVLDDFHLICSKQALTFAERCTHLNIPGLCMVIVSRKEPPINTISLFSKGQVSVITEEDLRFTEEEISAFLKLLSIPYATKNLPRIIAATKGWAIALRLLSLVLVRRPDDILFALNTMKQNIYKLLESEAWNDLTKTTRRSLVKASLVFNLPFAAAQELFGEGDLMSDAPQLASFLWFDSLIGDYRIHPLYLDFLQSRHNLLSVEEKQETFGRAAQWCSENSLKMDAMDFFAKSHQYKRMLETLLSYPFKLPYDTCAYFLGILSGLDTARGERDNHSLLLLLHVFAPLLLLWTDRCDEAKARTFEIIMEWERRTEDPFSPYILSASYCNLAYIDMYLCTATHRYDAPAFLKKARTYFERMNTPPVQVAGPFTVADIRSFACLVGEGATLAEFDLFLDAARQADANISHFPHKMYCGYADLVAAEIAFFKNQPVEAKQHSVEAVAKARETNQHSIEEMASQYLFRLAVAEGDYPIAKDILRQWRSRSEEPGSWGRQMLYEFFTSLLYAQAGSSRAAHTWSGWAEQESADQVSVPIKELIIGVKFCLAEKKHTQALTLIGHAASRAQQERFLFGELIIALLSAIAKIKIGDKQGALTDFSKAYGLSFGGVFEMPFVECGKDLRPLLTAASNQISGAIPPEWLDRIGRKAAIYAKKSAVVLDAFKRDKRIADTVSLSEREREVVLDLYHGLSREEIATNRYLSINTVHKIISSIYIKLDANNVADAIRIALEKNLL